MQAAVTPTSRSLRRRRPAPRRRRPVPVSRVASKPVVREEVFVADTSGVQNDFEQPLSTDFFNTLGQIRAVPATSNGSELATRTIAQARGYKTEDLDVIAQMATNYLLNGSSACSHFVRRACGGFARYGLLRNGIRPHL